MFRRAPGASTSGSLHHVQRGSAQLRDRKVFDASYARKQEANVDGESLSQEEDRLSQLLTLEALARNPDVYRLSLVPTVASTTLVRHQQTCH